MSVWDGISILGPLGPGIPFLGLSLRGKVGLWGLVCEVSASTLFGPVTGLARLARCFAYMYLHIAINTKHNNPKQYSP